MAKLRLSDIDLTVMYIMANGVKLWNCPNTPIELFTVHVT